MNIVVIGSFMMDLVVRAEQAPKAGETVMGHAFARFPGGKGANQAVAAARLGGRVTMAGMLGRDEFGREMLAVMQREGINTDHILFSESDPTGIGSIVLEANGENRIVVVPGANLRYSGQELHGIEDLIRSASILVMQLEMDPGMTEEAVALASRYRVPVLLNPAPARPLSGSLLRQVTYLTPNEAEAELLSGIPATSIDGAQAAGRALLHAGVRHVIITMADKGALIVDDGGIAVIEGYPVTPVDSVAAGDSFNGALAVRLARGDSLREAVRFANAVGALTVTRPGAIPSLPTLNDVEQFRLNRANS
ncbi:ribokinase [Paenibacillus dendritiformis]|uniref:ribokinase n=1 Tax=Paenibacillus dendritiformis TaxID=130049 RepID=UPI000DA7883A|nr:ribokinase [Paenibacillus dendritiformis]PZM66284.1 ribokinase [Paenibacillus dendritiformis]